MKYKQGLTSQDFWKIDGASKQSFRSTDKPKTAGAYMYLEFLKWQVNGGVVEPQYTAEEQTVKEDKDAADLIVSKNAEARAFLTDTDWKVTRHRDQIANDYNTSLSETDYKALLTERQIVRNSVMEET